MLKKTTPHGYLGIHAKSAKFAWQHVHCKKFHRHRYDNSLTILSLQPYRQSCLMTVPSLMLCAYQIWTYLTVLSSHIWRTCRYWQGFVVISLRWKCRQPTTNFYNVGLDCRDCHHAYRMWAWILRAWFQCNLRGSWFKFAAHSHCKKCYVEFTNFWSK